MQWRYMINGVEHGPVESQAIFDMVSAGLINDDTPVLREGAQAWEWQMWREARAAYGAELKPAKAIVTPVLIAANVLVFGAMAANGVNPISPSIEGLLRWGADFGPLTTHGQWWRMVSSMFVHIGVLHIAFNMYVLFRAGRIIERMLGSVAFTVLYMLAGIGGSLASLAWHPNLVSAGASGAIFGLFGGLLGYLARHGKTVAPETVKALRNYALTFIGYNLLFGVSQSGIDMAAHGGGLVSGLLLGLMLAVPAGEVKARIRRSVAVALAGSACLAAAAAGLHPSNTVLIGNTDQVHYTGSATRSDAATLGAFLKASGFFRDRGVTVGLEKDPKGAVISFTMSQTYRDKPEKIDQAFEVLGPEIASTNIGLPLRISLLDANGKTVHEIKVTRRFLTVGSKDRVYYNLGVTEEEARTLGRVLLEKKFLNDRGSVVTLLRGSKEGTVVAVTLTGPMDQATQKTLTALGHDVAPAVGGPPITLRVTGGAGGKTTDILIR